MMEREERREGEREGEERGDGKGKAREWKGKEIGTGTNGEGKGTEREGKERREEIREKDKKKETGRREEKRREKGRRALRQSGGFPEGIRPNHHFHHTPPSAPLLHHRPASPAPVARPVPAHTYLPLHQHQ